MGSSGVVTDIKDYLTRTAREVERLLGVHSEHRDVPVVVDCIMKLTSTDLNVVRWGDSTTTTSHHRSVSNEVIPAAEVLVADESGRSPDVTVELSRAVNDWVSDREVITKSHAGTATSGPYLMLHGQDESNEPNPDE
jgi:hypothetical protein